MNLDDKIEQASTILTNIRSQIQQHNENLSTLSKNEQQLIGRINTLREIKDEEGDVISSNGHMDTKIVQANVVGAAEDVDENVTS